jgi:uncharacterized protein
MQFTAEKQQQLEAILVNYQDTEMMHIDEVRGFFTAMISGPDECNVADWMDVVLGSEDSNADKKEAATALINDMLADIHTALQNKTFATADILVAPLDGDQITGLALWTNAYLYALDIVATDWFEFAGNDEDFEDLFYPLMALGGMYEDEGISFDDKELHNFAKELPDATQVIYNYLQATKNKPKTQKREGDKVGRNDPCPCNSGKKFKACCDK